MAKQFEIESNQIILHTDSTICTTSAELLHSSIFKRVVRDYCKHLLKHDSPLLSAFLKVFPESRMASRVAELLGYLSDHTLAEVVDLKPELAPLLEAENRRSMHAFVEGLYDFWRRFDRFMILQSEPGKTSFDRRPYRSFNITSETLTHVVRATYRDIAENITGDHPRIYRQVFAGCDVSLIAVPKTTKLPKEYRHLEAIPFIRHVWIAPPMIIDPPMNKRSGGFTKVQQNPLSGLELDRQKWLCYPAQVGPLVVFVYFHQSFMSLGCSLANLFEMASNEQIAEGPDAVYCFGVDSRHMAQYGDKRVVFHDDRKNNLIVGAVPAEDQFGYFGYLKKMILTLHNVVMMKRGRMPYHGAMFHLSMTNGRQANLVVIGDTATGKSETLEAFRLLGEKYIRELRIVADDMGSFEVRSDGRLVGYGTETGAFVRLDDLQAGYAFEQIDRAIIMSPQKINARAVLPVTSLHEVLLGYEVDYLLYANNYEQTDQDHAILQRFESPEQALNVFREGASMAKGTTSSTGLGHCYFANIFGPTEYRDQHDKLAAEVFDCAFESGVFVGQLRTRLGIPGYETSGPAEAAQVLFETIYGPEKKPAAKTTKRRRK